MQKSLTREYTWKLQLSLKNKVHTSCYMANMSLMNICKYYTAIYFTQCSFELSQNSVCACSNISVYFVKTSALNLMKYSYNIKGKAVEKLANDQLNIVNLPFLYLWPIKLKAGNRAKRRRDADWAVIHHRSRHAAGKLGRQA